MARDRNILSDTIEALQDVKAECRTLRATAIRLGLDGASPAVQSALSNILHAKHEHVSIETENEVRRALGLAPRPAVRLAEVCIDCGQLHNDGLRCYNKPAPLAIVIEQGREAVVDTTAYELRRRKIRPVIWRDMYAMPPKELAQCLLERKTVTADEAERTLPGLFAKLQTKKPKRKRLP